MKKLALIIAFLLLAFLTFGQTTFYNYVSEHYKVNSDVSRQYAQQVAVKMEAAMDVFNSILHFGASDSPTGLKVTIFEDKTGFDAYLDKILGHTRDNFVYIHYSDPSKSELVGFIKEDEKEYNASLLHQGFIQFFKAAIPNPPIWLREGIATYLENCLWNDKTQQFKYRPNYAWLDSLKAIIRGDDGPAPPLVSLLARSNESLQVQFETFYPMAWGAVAFLMESDFNEYNRILWDSLSILAPAKSLKENSLDVMRNILAWHDEKHMVRDFRSFINSIKTFYDLVSEGINRYTLEDYEEAVQNFKEALALEPQNYIPYYYLGLISYANREYIQAEGYYKAALALGAETSLTNYALGVNAFADNNFDQASTYLAQARDQNPRKYSDKVDSLLLRIETLR